jgi:hypothetical protein
MGRGEIEELRERLRAYRWSSYRGYAGLGSVADWVREEETFGELGLEGRKDRRVRYRRFVESDLVRGKGDPLRALAGQLILGSESFVQKMKDRLRSRTEGAGAGGLNGRGFLRARERGEAVLEEIAARVGRSKEALCIMRCPRGDAARGEAMAR